MSGLIPNRQALHDLWHERLKDAKLRLDFARNYAREVHRDFPPGATLSPDGAFAQRKAIRAETFAFAHYRRVLEIYTDLTVKGRIPDESEWPEPNGAGPCEDSHRTGTSG
jgi:hypothetical protein